MIKKFLIIFVIFFFVTSSAIATEFLPRYNDSILNYGIGLYFGEGQAIVYDEPSKDGKVIAKLYWDTDNVYINDSQFKPNNTFAVFLPKNALSGFIVLDEQGEDYIKIIYDIQNNKSGWLKKTPETKAYYWRQLFYKYGKTKGIYIFANVPKDEKILKLSPDAESAVSYELYYPRYIRLQLIKGNWALLKVVDFNNEQKVGWFQWRNSDGTLNAFPDFKGE